MTSLSAPRLRRAAAAAAAAGAAGALTLVEHRRLGPWAHGAYRIGVAAFTGALAAGTSHPESALLDPAREGIVTGGVTLGLMDVLERVDGSVVDGLQKLGVPHPRPVLAVLGAAGAAAMVALPSLAELAPHGRSVEEMFDQPDSSELPGEVAALIEALLADPPEGPAPAGAEVLRAQLPRTRVLDPGYAGADVTLHVEEPERLAVPRQQTWPVTGHFRRGAIGYALMLHIHEGRLSMLSVMVPGDEPRLEHALEMLALPGFVLPGPEEITLARETETP